MRGIAGVLMRQIFEQAHSTPQKTALIHNARACSYAGFARCIAVAHLHLARLDLPAGSIAVLCVEDIGRAWVLGIALRHLGLVTVQAQAPDAVAELGLPGIGCVVMLADEPHARLLAQAGAAAWRLVVVDPQHLPGLGPQIQPGAQDGVAPGCEASALVEPVSDKLAAGHMLLTSGTTGTYKKILRDARVEASTLGLHAEINAITPDSVVYVRDFPPWTAGGYRWPLVTWSQGATVVFQQGGDFERPYRLPGLTHAFATPATLGFLQREGAQAAPRDDGMRLLVTGGAMTRALAEAALSRLSSHVYTVLASTEALTLAVTRIADLDDLPWHHIHPRREVQVVDVQGQVLPHGQLGLVRARVLDGLCGYVGDAEASRRFFRDGWFYSGDLGTTRPDGRLALSGRVTDVVNVKGHKLATGPIERELQDRLHAETVCVLALPGPQGDEELHVVVERRHTIDRAELEAMVQEPASKLRALGRLQFHVLATLPRNSMGKVLRLQLRQQLLAKLGR